MLGTVALLVGLAGCDRLDRSFGEGGVVRIAVQAAAAAPSGDGLAVIGTRTDTGAPAVVRYDADGRQDLAFGDADGLAPVRGISLEQYVAMAPVPGGGLVVTGVAGQQRFAVARYLADGTLDPAFGTDGVATHPGELYPSDVAVAPDGSVVVTNERSMHLAVLSPDGRRSRILQTRVGDFGSLTAAAVQADGRIVVAGHTVMRGQQLRDLVVLRYLPDGTVDTSFAWLGVAALDLGGDDVAQSLAVDGAGRLILSAHSSLHSVTRQWVVRLDHDGRTDGTFGDGGRARARQDFHGEGRDLHVRPDGRIVTIGVGYPRGDGDLLTTQWLGDGRVDGAWGEHGTNLTDLGGWEHLQAGALLPDGRLLAVGHDVLVRYAAP